MEDYVVVKLITGETVMATFDGEDEKFVDLRYPIQIRTIMIPEIQKESISAAPLCQFSDATSFILEKSHIVYIKKLHQQFVPHYKNFLKSYEEALVPATRDSVLDSLEEYFEDADELTLEEVTRRLDMLEAIANAPIGEATEPSDDIVFVEGNDTVH